MHGWLDGNVMLDQRKVSAVVELTNRLQLNKEKEWS